MCVGGTGAWLSIDNLGFVVNYAPLDVRADNIARLWAEGYGSRVLLGNDTCETGQFVANGGPGYANVIQRAELSIVARTSAADWTLSSSSVNHALPPAGSSKAKNS